MMSGILSSATKYELAIPVVVQPDGGRGAE